MEPDSGKRPLSGFSNGLNLSRFKLNYTYLDQAYQGGKKEALDYYSLQILPLGKHVYRIDKEEEIGWDQRAVMLSAGQVAKIQSSKDNSILALVIEDHILRDIISSYTGHDNFPSIRFRPKVDMSNPGNNSLVSVVQNFVAELNRNDGILEIPTAVASFEELLLSMILFGMDHSLRDYLDKPLKLGDSLLVKSVEDYLEAHADQPFTMQDLAKKYSHSASSIYRTFKRYRGYTPMAFLQKVRFTMARKRLLNPVPGDTVTGIAMDCGFFHLGRFAGAYWKRFGESPKETLKKNLRNRYKIT